jgi:hypothetical protein
MLDEKNKRIIVPRFGLPLMRNKKYGLKNVSVKNLITPGQNIEVDWHGKLTNNQTAIMEYLMENVYTDTKRAAGTAGCILNLEAGQGKTYVAARLIAECKKKTCFILHSSATLDQTHKALDAVLDVSIGEYHAKKKRDGDVVLMVINSALSEKFQFKNGEEQTPTEFYRQFGLVIFDECHLHCNKWAGQVFKYAQAINMLGLSATPDGNAKGFGDLIIWELGPVIDATEIPGYKSADVNFTAMVKRVMYYGPAEYTKFLVNEATGCSNSSTTITMLAHDPYRIRLILNCIEECLAKGLYIYVFADRRNYLEIIRLQLVKLYESKRNSNEAQSVELQTEILLDDDDFQRIVGGAKEEEFKTAEMKSRVIFTTYQYMGTGKSIIKMNAMIFATPRKSQLKQYYGRIFRLSSDSTVERQIYLISDMKTMFGKHWSAHNKHIKAMGYQHTKVETVYTDLVPVVLPKEYNSLEYTNAE